MTLARIALLAGIALAALSTAACGAADTEASEQGSVEDDATAATFTEDDDLRASYFDEARPITVVLEAGGDEAWIVESDGGLGAPRSSVRQGTHTFRWKKSVVTEGAHELRFIRRNQDTQDKTGQVTILFVVGQPATEGDQTISLQARDRTVVVVEGSRVILELEENASTGYLWELVSAPSALPRPDREYVAPRNGGPVGGGGFLYFTWSTEGAVGTHPITFQKSRSDGHVADTFSFEIEVRASASN